MRKLDWLSKQGVWLLLLVMIIVGSLLSPAFLTWNNIFNVLRQAVALSFVSIGQTFAIIADCVDLSVGPMVSLVQSIAAKTMMGEEGKLLLVLATTVFVVLIVGIVNGIITAKRKANPFIVTLGTMIILNGVVLLYTNEQPVGSVPASFRLLADGYLGPIPFPVIFVTVGYIIAHILLLKTKYGRYALAVGGNEEVARLAGIPVTKIKILAYIISAAGAAITGLFLAARMNIGDPLVGQTLSLDSIAAVVIGGTLIEGGRGSIFGTLGGVLLYSILSNLMNLTNVSPFYQIVVKGAVIVLAVTIYQLQSAKDQAGFFGLKKLITRIFPARNI